MPRVGPVILWQKHRFNPENGPPRYSHILLHTPTITVRRTGVEDHGSQFHTQLRIGRLTLTWTLHHAPKPTEDTP